VSGLQIVGAVYLGAGAVRSLFKTRKLRSLVDEPQGGAARLLAVYLLLAVLWLPVDLLFWAHAKLEGWSP
jgi:hypothetical protein